MTSAANFAGSLQDGVIHEITSWCFHIPAALRLRRVSTRNAFRADRVSRQAISVEVFGDDQGHGISGTDESPVKPEIVLGSCPIRVTPGSIYRVRLAMNRDLLGPRAQGRQAHPCGHGPGSGCRIGQKRLVRDMHGDDAIDRKE